MKDADKALLAEMLRGAKLMFDNAESLYNEAQLLGMNGHFARAACLHQLSMEECSKVDMLGASALGMTMGHPIDIKKLTKQMTKHEVKNFNNAYFSLTTDEERAARKNGDFAKAGEIFEKQQREIHKWLNDVKNGGLYVDYTNGEFVAPNERITEEVAVVMQRLNAFFLNHAQNHVKLFTRLQDQQDAMLARVNALMSKMADLKKLPKDKVVEAFYEHYERWMEEQIEMERAKRAGEPK